MEPIWIIWILLPFVIAGRILYVQYYKDNSEISKERIKALFNRWTMARVLDAILGSSLLIAIGYLYIRDGFRWYLIIQTILALFLVYRGWTGKGYPKGLGF